jgi:hypothetical protein
MQVVVNKNRQSEFFIQPLCNIDMVERRECRRVHNNTLADNARNGYRRHGYERIGRNACHNKILKRRKYFFVTNRYISAADSTAFEIMDSV